MFNSKSKLTHSESIALRIECEAIAAWCTANKELPWADTVEQLRLPMTFLGGGYFGKAYALHNFPGLVVKLCRDKNDLYPEFARRVHSGKSKAACLPRVFMVGGDELDGGTFWCVLPKYTTIREKQWNGEQGLYNVVTSLTTTAMQPAMFADFDWYSGGIRRIRADRGLSKKQRREVRVLRDVLAPIAKYSSFGLDIHIGNVMLDGEQFVITDPLPGMDSWEHDVKETKYALRANLKR